MEYSARVLYPELRPTRRYTGSYDTVKRFVQPLRAVRLQAERALLPFEAPPGQQSQIDWGGARVYFRHHSRSRSSDRCSRASSPTSPRRRRST